MRVNVEAEAGVTGFMVEKALKEALGFSPRGDVYPIGGLPGRRGRRSGRRWSSTPGRGLQPPNLWPLLRRQRETTWGSGSRLYACESGPRYPLPRRYQGGRNRRGCRRGRIGLGLDLKVRS